jgi:subtilisin-like proprotein convertase family protein
LLNGFGSQDVVVGVTDDGCKLDHVDFNSPGKFAGWAYLEGIRLFRRGDPGALPDDMYQTGANHGTSCAGVIAAEADAEMTVGAAPGCRLLPIKWESSGPSLFISDSKLLIVLNYVADRVDILSNSWGGAPVSRWSRDVRERIEELAATGGRRGKGILFLWAAGNENCPIDHRADQEVPYTHGWELINGSWEWVGVKTAKLFSNDLVGIPGVMHVAALASTAQRSHYSNYGPGIEICAPSSNSHEYSRLVLDGLGITTTTGKTSGVSHTFGGTSSATPLVAGIAALIVSANPELTALEVASILRRTASKDLNMTEYPRTPPMIDDPNPDWDVSPVAPFDTGEFRDVGSQDGTWSPWFGHGRVDALEAVRETLGAAQGQTTRVRVELNPNMAIPDQDPAGIVSRVFVPDSGQIRSLSIFVDITHPYIGDLVVRVTDPDGNRIDLHQRDGGSADNLVRTFTRETVPTLATFLGKDIKGTWSLEVSDHAKFDEGHLRRWTLAAEVLADTTRRFESAPGRKIPDQDPAGITDHISVSGMETVRDIAVDVDISHTYIGDLRVSLSNPGSREVVLHAREGRSADDIQRTYTVEDEAGLRDFVGQPANGDWALSVSDHASRDVGKLNRWALTLR